MKNIAVICTSLSATAFQDCYQGIRECAIANNCNVFFFSCDRMVQSGGRYERGQYNIFNATDFKRFDGGIFLSNTFTEDLKAHAVARKLEDAGIPMVSIEGDSRSMFNFRIDNRLAMYEMVHHFIQDHGFSRIAYVSGPLGSYEADERYEAYVDALHDAGIKLDEELVYEGDYMPQSGRDAGVYFLNRKGDLPQAIVCANDFMAMGLNEHLSLHGIKVPEQIAISGFDDSPEAKYTNPRLTTVSRENYKAGYAACAKLLSDYSPDEDGKLKTLQTSVIKRESCGCVSREDFDQEKFRRIHFRGLNTQQFFMLETRRLYADLTAVKTLDDLREILTPYVKHMKCDDFYLCLSNEWEGFADDYITEGYGSGTYLAFSQAQHAHRDLASFGIDQLIEGLQDKSLGRNCFVVVPIHFADRMFGYVIISNSDYTFDCPLFQNWLQIIGYGLESIRKENILASMGKKLDSLWIYDNLTGLYNRDGFNKYALPVWLECAREKKEVSMFFVDLDELKKVNDVYGHDVGDRFIKAVAAILKRRKHHGEVIMRFGGDEFVILDSGMSQEEARSFCDAVYADVDDYNKMHNLPTKISVTIGYYLTVPEDAEGLDLAIEAADSRKYEDRREKDAQ